MQIGFQLFTFEPMFVFFKIFVRIQLIFRMDKSMVSNKIKETDDIAEQLLYIG